MTALKLPPLSSQLCFADLPQRCHYKPCSETNPPQLHNCYLTSQSGEFMDVRMMQYSNQRFPPKYDNFPNIGPCPCRYRPPEAATKKAQREPRIRRLPPLPNFRTPSPTTGHGSDQFSTGGPFGGHVDTAVMAAAAALGGAAAGEGVFMHIA